MQEFEFTGDWSQLGAFWNAAVITAYDAMIKCCAIVENVSKKDGPLKIIRGPKDLDGIVATLTKVTDMNKAPKGFREYMGYLDSLHIPNQLILEGESHSHFSSRKFYLPGQNIGSQLINIVTAICTMSKNRWVNPLSIDYPVVKNPNCKVVLMLDAYRFSSFSQFQSRSEFEMLGQGYFNLLQNMKTKLEK